jgi:hypothetical protein
MRERESNRDGAHEDDGWTLVTQGRERNRHQIQTITFYVTNFPEETNEELLWQKFSRWGRVTDVFIPKKTNKHGKKFGFVRFKTNANIAHLESDLNNCWIDLYKLRVNVSRFSRYKENDKQQQGRRSIDHNRNQWKEKDYEASLMQRREGCFHRNKEGYRQGERRHAARSKSYAQIVTGTDVQRHQEKQSRISKLGIENKWKGMEYKSKLEEGEWLKNGFVGTVHKAEDIMGLQEKLMEAGIYSISTRYMGGKKVFIGINENENMAELLKEEETTLRKWFSSIVKWSPDQIARERY